MKPIILVLDKNVETAKEFDTVKEAQESLNPDDHAFADIYTLYASAEFKIEWKLATDTGANLREVKKSKATKQGQRKGEWSPQEVDTLIANYGEGMSLSAIAKGLHRPYNSIYTKATALGLIGHNEDNK